MRGEPSRLDGLSRGATNANACQTPSGRNLLHRRLDLASNNLRRGPLFRVQRLRGPVGASGGGILGRFRLALELPLLVEEVSVVNPARRKRIRRLGDVDDRPVGQLGILLRVRLVVPFAERE